MISHGRTFAVLVTAIVFGQLVSAQEDGGGETVPTIYVAGDSTAADGVEGARGWGRHLPRYFEPRRARVENRARGGRSSRTFVTEGLWEKLHSELRAGDVVMIQFGHNDGGPINDTQRAHGSLPGLGDETEAIDNLLTKQPEVVHTFGWYMRKMITETRAAGATPVLLTLTVRNIWEDGRVERGSGQYSEWARELALAENVPLIDLTSLVADEYERRGRAAVAALFPRDHTHTSDAGALLNARLVTEGFRGLREEMWSPWLSAQGRDLPRAGPGYVLMPRVDRGTSEASLERFLNTPYPVDDSLPTLWIIGDSTVRTGRGRGENGQFGWGDPLENYFDLNAINVVNRAMGGTGARTFRTGGFWEPVLEQIRSGDVVLMQFGHNDNGQRGALPGVGPRTERRVSSDGTTETVETFGAYLRRFVAEIREKQATPVIFSPIPRKIWRDGRILRSGDGHAAWARELAAEEQVTFVDLYDRIARRYDTMGPDAVEAMFADQGVHTTYAGARLNAECVIEGLKNLADNPVQDFLRPDSSRY